MQAEVFAAISPDAYGDNLTSRHDAEGSLWCGPELLRIAALRSAGHPNKATEDALRRAYAIADEQGTAAWMARIEVSLRAAVALE